MSSQLHFPGRGLLVTAALSKLSTVSTSPLRKHLSVVLAPRRDDQLSADTKTAHFRPRPAQPGPATRTLIVIVKLLQRGFMSRNKGKGLARRWVPCPPASPAQPSPGILRCPMSVVIFCSQLAGLCSGCSGAHWAGASSGYTDDWAAASSLCFGCCSL